MLSEQIRQKALDLGFDLAGITDANPLHPDYLNHLTDWLKSGYAGDMAWMLKNLDKRTNPACLLPGAQSVIVVGLNYKPVSSLQDDEAVLSEAKDLNSMKGQVASYAHYEDYHPFIKKQLRKLVDFLISAVGPGLKFQICVDSAPVLERALAVRAGLGFIGKNHMLTNPSFGPQLFLGEVITNLDLRKSEIRNPKSAISTCLSCGKCVAACPTGALRPDGHFDATKCINYLTIESDSKIPSDLIPKIGNHLFGCSDCLLACPFQQNAPACSNTNFTYYHDRAELNLHEVLNLTEEKFQIKFADSPILRPGLSRIKHVAGICLQNSSHNQKL